MLCLSYFMTVDHSLRIHSKIQKSILELQDPICFAQISRCTYVCSLEFVTPSYKPWHIIYDTSSCWVPFMRLSFSNPQGQTYTILVFGDNWYIGMYRPDHRILWQSGMSNFQRRDTKLARFCQYNFLLFFTKLDRFCQYHFLLFLTKNIYRTRAIISRSQFEAARFWA